MSSALAEIKSDVWHILLHLFAYQERSSRLGSCGTRVDLVHEIVALNALAEIIVLRVARLADARRDVRSIKNYCKRHPVSSDSQSLAARFHQTAEAVVRLRHEKIAHMKPGDSSGYPLDPVPAEVFRAIEWLVCLVDSLSGTEVKYVLRVGSQERLIDLRASVSSGDGGDPLVSR
jgi:hypothetical protein